MTIYIMSGGCPLCGRDVKGNDQYKYFCQSCNMLFEKRHLVKKKIEKKEAEPIVIPDEPEVFEPRVVEPDSPISEDTEPVEAAFTFVVSKESNKMHISTCHFIKKIQDANLKGLDSLEKGKEKGFEPCVCIRRKGLMKI